MEDKIKMTKLDKIAFLEENGIEWFISKHTGILYGLCKMSTFTGDDCSEWIEFDEIVEALKQ